MGDNLPERGKDQPRIETSVSNSDNLIEKWIIQINKSGSELALEVMRALSGEYE